MVVLPYLSAIRITGSDAGDFLHGQLSADVLALTTGESVFACYCEPKGRVLALMLVSKLDERYDVVMSRVLLSGVLQRLRMYRMRSKVEFGVDESREVAVVPAGQSFSGVAHAIKIPDSDAVFVVASGKSTSANSSGDAPQNSWKLSELKQGVVWLSTQTSGQFLPQMLGFDALGAVNYKKGCYPGQEIVARTHYLGKVKRHPRLVCDKTECDFEPMQKIQLQSGDESYDAIVTDSVACGSGGGCAHVITRMDPALRVDSIL